MGESTLREPHFSSHSPILILGLTGSLGNGKSTVARIFEDLGGARVIDADEIAHRLQAPGGQAYVEIVRVFGSEVLGPEQRIDRKKLASVVFSDRAKLQQLNAIVHGKVRAEEHRLLDEYRKHPLVVLMVPLLLENHAESLVDHVVVVTVDAATRLVRLVERSGMTADEVEKRLAAQMSDEEKIRRADFVIDNSGPIEATRSQVRKVLQRLGFSVVPEN